MHFVAMRMRVTELMKKESVQTLRRKEALSNKANGRSTLERAPSFPKPSESCSRKSEMVEIVASGENEKTYIKLY